MKQPLYYYFVRILLLGGKILPRHTLYALTDWIMRQYYRRRPKRVEIMHANIRRAFPRMKDTEIDAFGRRVYAETAKTIAEWMLLYHGRLDPLAAVTNRAEVLPKLEAIKTRSHNGVIVITAHYGNWEILGSFLGATGFPVKTVFKSTGNPLIDSHILIPSRETFGNSLIAHKGSMSSMVKTLASGDTIALLIDQVVQPPNGVPVNFFAHPTAATKAVAALKQKYDPAVVPVFIQRVGMEKFVVEIGDPVEPDPAIYTDKQQQLIEITQQYYDIIEAQIRQAPEQWLWLYNRWKRIVH